MSYSFSVSGASKDEAKQAIAKQFDTIVQQQSAHEADREAAETVACAFVDLLADPTGSQRINVAVYGSIAQQHADDPAARATTSASVNVSATVV